MSDLRCLCYSLTSDPPIGIYSHETVDTAQTRHKALRAPTNRLSGSFFHHAVGALYMGVGGWLYVRLSVRHGHVVEILFNAIVILLLSFSRSM